MKNISDRKKFWETAQPYLSEKYNKLLRLEKILRFWLMKKNWRLIDQIFCILYIFCVLQFIIIMKSLFFSLDLNSKLTVIISSIIDIQRVFTWDCHLTVYMIQPEVKLIAGVISLWSFWQKCNFILVDKRSCKHYPKWNHTKGNTCTWLAFT